MSQTFDVVVIGAGPGGYIAAVRAAQLGLKTACIEGWKNPKGELALGGTCLNVGCIPSKALLASSEEFEKVNHHLDEHGIAVSGAKIDIARMQSRKDAIVTKMTKGIEFLFKKNKITWLQGFGQASSAGGDLYTIEVANGAKVETVQAKHVIVATGSKARHLPNVPVDNATICDNEGALAFAAAPKRLGVIGAGVIGLELGSVWRRLGSEVTILEALPVFLGACDEAVQKEAWKVFTKGQGLNIRLGREDRQGDDEEDRRARRVHRRQGPRPEARVRQARGLRGAHPQHRRPGGGERGPQGGRARLRRGRLPLPHQPAQRLGHRRRGARADARAQGRGRGRDGRRAHRRPEAAHRLRLHPVDHLHLARGRLGGHDGAEGEGGRDRA